MIMVLIVNRMLSEMDPHPWQTCKDLRMITDPPKAPLG